MSGAAVPRSKPDQRLVNVLGRLREERGLSQEQLAHEAGLTASGYNRIEAGKSSPGWSTVCRLAEALGVSLRELAEAVEAERG
jgi:transcriptional regulator with XRE-family HTH domain